MTRHLAQLSTAFALLVLGGMIAPLAGSRTGDPWLHGEQCAMDGQGPVLCMEQP